jgi:hypothetical protein
LLLCHVSHRLRTNFLMVPAWARVRLHSSQVAGISLGELHNVAIRAVPAGACSGGAPPPAVFEWFEFAVGVGMPVIATAPAATVFSSFASFAFGATAAPGTTFFMYSLDGSSWTPSGATLRVGPVSPGLHVLSVRCSDGSTVSANRSTAWTVLSQSNSVLQVWGRAGGSRQHRAVLP